MPGTAAKFRIVLGITGASGSIYGWRLLEKLSARSDAEVHFILSRSGERTAFLELGKTAADFRSLAGCTYPPEDVGCRGAIPLGKLKSRADVMAFDQTDGVPDEHPQRGLAGLFDNRGKS